MEPIKLTQARVHVINILLLLTHELYCDTDGGRRGVKNMVCRNVKADLFFQILMTFDLPLNCKKSVRCSSR